MKTFKMRELHEAELYAAQGGQALHIHSLSAGHPVFKGYKQVGHLFDQDKNRLIKTARKTGVHIIEVERPGELGQHMDLCGKPFEKACSEAGLVIKHD